MDGFGSPEEHIDFALENGLDGIAITEHGHMNSVPFAYFKAQELKKKGTKFKYIPGIEAYYHPDLKTWERQKFDSDEAKKLAKEQKKVNPDLAVEEDASEGATVENEDATKDVSKWFNPVNRRHHLVLLPKSNRGVESLFRLTSRGYKEGFYKFPRIDAKMLKELGKEVIVSSACIGGNLAYDVLTEFPGVPFDELTFDKLDDSRVMDKVITKMGNSIDVIADAVGCDNVFAEIQFNNLSAQHLVNRALIEFSSRTGIKLVAAADSHYPRPEAWLDREIYKKLGRLNYDKIDPSMLPKDISELKCELYPKNAEQMWAAYKSYTDGMGFYDDSVVSNAIETGWHIAHDLIGDITFDNSMKLPGFVVPPGMTDMEALIEACKEGFIRRGLKGKKNYVDRLKHELKIIEKKNFARYFLTMKAIIDIAHENMMVGAGRGSGGGSLVNYLLGITQLDPIRYGLIFERFISLARHDEPDIDNDIADRDLLLSKMKDKFGDENVIPITNVNLLQLKSLVKDVSRLYGLDFNEVNEMTRKLDSEVKPHAIGKENKSLFQLKYDDCVKYSQSFRTFVEKYPQVAERIKSLYKQPKSLGRHAGGVVVIDDAEKYMPLITVRKEVQTPWPEGMNIKCLSPLAGIIKFDVLGLETLRMIQRAIELILVRHEGKTSPTWKDVKEWYDRHLAPGVINEEDPKVFDHVFQKKRFAGIFQFTERHTQRFIHEFAPSSVQDLSVATAIYRPGPLAAKADQLYIKRKRGLETVTADHHAIEKVLGRTYYLPIFQEQIMSLAHELAGMSLDDCDRLRKAILKRSVTGEGKNKSESEVLEEMFIDGAEKNGYPRKKAVDLFNDIRGFASYAFNESHSVAYAFCSYQTAWLMTYYEPEWLCAYIESMIGDPESRGQALSEVKSFGYKIGKIDINYSDNNWMIAPDGKTFVPSFRSVKGAGDIAIAEIKQNRKYLALCDLLWKPDGTWRHSKFNKRVLENLIKVEAFGSMDMVGEGKTFSNYKQMHVCLIENFDKLKKKNGREFLDKLIEETRSLEDWTTIEKVTFYKELVGDINVDLVVDPEVQEYLSKKGVTSIEDAPFGKSLSWFVLAGTKPAKTKNGKPYLLLFAMGPSGKQHKIFLWGADPEKSNLSVNSSYIAEIEKNDFGFSSRINTLRKLD